ncbi:Fucose permease [Chitinophaga jiangningensis]|uniref:Fucose permease n=1 Tax=Chitinophaga jiangningensis TaxID=1419482 RepID=A0A1M6WY90_9BACT|nr:MFS transporter [Chitinophaga jiangningensis]SHK98559.1 Fucose permease [Chitinophaga jiangningensis]
MAKAIQPSKLFVASCMALLVTSLSFGIRAGILGDLGKQFDLSASQLGIIASTAFWGFPLAVVIGGFVVDIIGMKRLLLAAFVLHLAGILLTIFATGFSTLFVSTLFIGMANGTVEAACNPLVATIYPNNKTTKLNHFHLWFPGGIVVGALVVFFLSGMGLNYKVQMATMIIPTLLYGYLFLKLDFPVTERVASGISNAQMYRSIGSPLFIVIFVLMFGTAITELFTGQWIEVLLKNVTENAILILAMTAGVQTLGRAFAGPIVHRMSPTGVLLISAVLSAVGLYMLAHVSGNMVFLAAFIFGMGVTYFWPCMIGFVSENIPESGALGMNLVGGAGMFAVSIYTIFMGGFYDSILAKQLPAGASLDAYRTAAAGTEEAAAFAKAQAVAGPEILNVTLVIPVVLIFAFTGLYFYMRNRKKPDIAIA